MKLIIGIDEVGRGAWAGPLVVGAVGLKTEIQGLVDSKLLTKKSRSILSSQIHQKAGFVGLGWVSPAEVDDLGLTKATTLACVRALENAPACEKIIIDGHFNYLPNLSNCETLVKGDLLVPAISAASIVAKVARDEFMQEQSNIYPEYCFKTNVGYGTKEHISAIRRVGLTPIHRWSYKPIREFMDTYET